MAAASASSRPLPHLSSYFDMRSFGGRLSYNWSLCNPLNLCWGEHAVAEACAVIANYQRGEHVTPHALQYAQTVMVSSAPQGTLAPAPCRTSGWGLSTVPVMAFIVSNAVSHPTSLPRIIIGQWLNQTQNAVITWYNRPATSGGGNGAPADETSICAAAAYCAACATAIPIAVGSGLAAQRIGFLRPFARFAPYPGVALANVMNTGMMRSDDLLSGVPVYCSEGSEATEPRAGVGVPLGVSSVTAGQRAVADTALTRTLIPLANFVAVPILMAGIERLRGAGRPRSLTLQVGVTAATLITAIPLASSTSAPIGTIAIDDVEPAVAAAARARDPSVAELRYERGF